MMRNEIIIRSEIKEDHPQVKLVNDLAFGQKEEGILVENIRRNPKFIPELSIVAELNNTILGHILFFPIEIINDGTTFSIISLAPMAVLPKFQKQGIGGNLINFGMEKCRELDFRSVVVLGHPSYYPKFGFQKASTFGISFPIDAPDKACMAIELVKDGLKGVSGTVRFPAEYDVAL